MTVAIQPVGNRIAVKMIEASEKTQGGIYIASKADEKVMMGEVVSVGEGSRVNDSVVPVTLKVGETVVFNQYSATEVEAKGETYWVVREDDVLAVIK